MPVNENELYVRLDENTDVITAIRWKTPHVVSCTIKNANKLHPASKDAQTYLKIIDEHLKFAHENDVHQCL